MKSELVARLEQAEAATEGDQASEPVVGLDRVLYATVVGDMMEVDAEGQPLGGDAVVPAYLLPGSYLLPEAQKSKRKSVAGAPKWTAKRRLQAAEDIANGKEPTPLPTVPVQGPATITGILPVLFPTSE